MSPADAIRGSSSKRLRCIVETTDGIQNGLDLLAERPHAHAFVWQHPATNRAIVAMGCIAEIRSCGPSRFAQARQAWQQLIGNTSVEYGNGLCEADAGVSARRPEAPLLVGGFGFFDSDPPDPWQEFPALRFVLPERLWVRDGDHAYSLRVESLDPCDAGDPFATPSQAESLDRREEAHSALSAVRTQESAADWLERTNAAIERIHAGDLKKIVLACSQSVNLPDRFSLLAAVARLCKERPSCATFLIRNGSSSFLGSSPEVLARVDNGHFETAALAGSEPRGQSEQEDRRRAEHLLSCAKNAREHGIVVEELRAKLSRTCGELHVSSRPEIRRLPESFHLSTAFSGRLTADRNLFDLAAALHPTAAVCGIPSSTAMQELVSDEPGRGWYSGASGWIDARGNGELTVALRSALVKGGRALVWAGAGVVDGSLPESELAEVENKMTALAGVLEDRALSSPGASTTPAPSTAGANSEAERA